MDPHTSTEAAKWFKAGTWKEGLQLQADETTNIEEFFKQYHANTQGWQQAFRFFKNEDLGALTPGKHIIDGDSVYASVMEAPNIDFEKTSWESHRLYNDIQYVISGKEKIGITGPDNAVVTHPYDASQDIAFYHTEGTVYSFQPGKFFIFFPQDLHRPGIKVDDEQPVKKIVFKIRTAGS